MKHDEEFKGLSEKMRRMSDFLVTPDNMLHISVERTLRDGAEAIEFLLAQNGELQANPKPLTLQELKQMKGQPVWVEDLSRPVCSRWHLVREENVNRPHIILIDARGSYNKVGDYEGLCYNVSEGMHYGETWLAYRHEKKTTQEVFNMGIQKGDMVKIINSAEESTYKGCIFEVLSEPYVVCESELVKMKCYETGKYFGGGYATCYLEKVVEA